MSEARMRLNNLANLLGRYSYRFSSEVNLHARLATVFEAEGIEFERERIMDARNRADFWVDGIVIEVKIDGSMPEALRQVDRYINLPDVQGVILAGTPRWAAEQLKEKPTWQDKPFQMVRLARQSL
ncbi:hypothetical protein [Pseudomonas gingeri]|uniref:hypothetical protein n=1 Tax=Pseudomonas gingeri TaxID=117681 RepID=UPI0015A38382|nr:hypothetical protein [Pseudomonas gingeri]NWA11927.1 hypothetical protein [Pseudomonas gingeri]